MQLAIVVFSGILQPEIDKYFRYAALLQCFVWYLQNVNAWQILVKERHGIVAGSSLSLDVSALINCPLAGYSDTPVQAFLTWLLVLNFCNRGRLISV